MLGLVAELSELAQARHRARERGGDRSQQLLARRVCDLIDASLPGQLPTIDAMARELCVGRTGLCAAFREVTGTSIGAYARTRRMETARELLACTTLPVAEVGRRVGYERAGSFTDAFEREHGVAPSAWRARQRG